MNNSSLEQLILRLQLIDLDRNNAKYFDEFEKIVCEIGYLNDPNSIKNLVHFFDDKSPEINLMWAIIHTIEIFESKIYIQEILEVSPVIYQKSPDWTLVVFARIINSEEDRLELVRQLRDSCPEIKRVATEIVKHINESDPIFLTKTIALMMAISG